MEIIAYQKSVRVSPRKLRLVADSVRSLHPAKALVHLQFMHKSAAGVLHKVMKQAVSNAINNLKLTEAEIKTKHIMVEEGPRYKRFNAASRGRARQILKRTSHIKVVLEGKEKTIEETKKINSTNKKETK